MRMSEHTDTELITANEACALLGISAATLYAYVSRGQLSSRPGPQPRSRVYLRAEVERLAQRKAWIAACQCWRRASR